MPSAVGGHSVDCSVFGCVFRRLINMIHQSCHRKVVVLTWKVHDASNTTNIESIATTSSNLSLLVPTGHGDPACDWNTWHKRCNLAMVGASPMANRMKILLSRYDSYTACTNSMTGICANFNIKIRCCPLMYPSATSAPTTISVTRVPPIRKCFRGPQKMHAFSTKTIFVLTVPILIATRFCQLPPVRDDPTFAVRRVLEGA